MAIGKKSSAAPARSVRPTLGLAGAGLLVITSLVWPTPTFAAPLTTCATITTSVVLQNDLVSTDGTCIRIGADNITVDGNGHRISVTGGTTDNWAVYDTYHHHLTVRNLVTDNGIYVYDTANYVSILDSTLGYVNITGADDAVVDHNVLSGLSVSILGANQPFRAQVTNNTISANSHTLVDMMGSGHVVTDNTMTSGYQCGGAGQPACDEPKVLFMRKGSGNTVSRNVVRSLASAMPVRFRDSFDDSTISDNTFWASGTVDGAFSAFNITSGNLDAHFPRNNTFTRNIIRADHDEAFWIEIIGPNNTFSYNTFLANSGNYVGTLGSDTNANQLFDHNTFYNSGSGAALGFHCRHTSTDTFTNNIFSYQGASVFTYDGCTNSNYAGGNNLFHDRNGAVSFSPFGATLTAWKSLVAPDDAGSSEGDPKFLDAPNNTFSLLAGSPALGMASDGTNIGAWQSSASCSELWSCGSWSACMNGTQTRVCVDTHACGTVASRPVQQQACSVASIDPSINPGPTLTIIRPASKAVLTGTAMVQITASDTDGVGRINFYIDGKKFGTDIRAPYRAVLDTRVLRNGAHTIMIQATDRLGNSRTVSRRVTTKNTFRVRLAVPWPGLRVQGAVTLRPQIIYGGASIARVEYWVDRKLRTTSNASPYAVRWFTARLKNGLHRVTIRVVDAAGKKATHTVVVRVVN